MKVTILSAITNDYDTVKPILPQKGVDVEWIMVLDSAAACVGALKNGWNSIFEKKSHLHPNRAAKTPKCLPWLYTDAEAVIWLDGSFKVVSDTFAYDMMKLADPIAQFVHPWRDCVYDEARECITLKKYAEQPLQEQMDAYRAQGHPDHWALWATGVMARWVTTPVVQMGHEWLSDIYNYSYQDQVSHPPACRRNGLRPTGIPGTHLANQWLVYQGSGRHSHG